jgi:integrase
VPKISDFSLKNLTPPERGQITIWDDKSPLGVRVSQGGSKTFIIMLGSGRRLTIGRYPDIKLAQARSAAERLKAEKTLGRYFPQSVSLSDAREQYLAQADVRANTRIYYTRALNRLKASKLGDITLVDVNRATASLGKSSSTQAMATMRAFFKWCVRPPRRYLAHSPLEGLQLAPGKPRKRVLKDDELKTVWDAAKRQGYPHGTLVQLLIVTGQRRGEIANLRRSWIDPTERTITLPDWITKNGRDHKLPYGEIALSILDDVPRLNRTDLLFPSRASDDHPLSGWSKYKRELADGVPGWTLHDLRRTYLTTHARIGTPPHIGERLINHISGVTSDVEEIYDVWTYLPEMRKAVESFEVHIRQVLQI